MNGLLVDNVEIQLGKDIVADTTSETITAVEDMEGFDEITWIVKLGDVDSAAVITMTPKENSASSTSSPAPTAIALSSVSAGALTSGALVLTEDTAGNLDDKIIVVTVARTKMTKRYVMLSITVASESYEIDAIIALKSKARTLPVTQPSDVYAVAKGVS